MHSRLAFLLAGAACALAPVPNTARRRRVVCRAADWTQSEDWALTDGAKRFTRSSRTGDERLFYEDLAASLGPAAGARPATELRARLEALGCTAPPPPRVLDAWREESAGERFSGTLDGDVTEVATARVSFLGAEETRYVETTGGEIIRLGTPADAPAAPVESPAPRLSLTAPTLPRWAPLAALPLALLLLAARSLAPPDGAAGTYLYESTTVVTCVEINKCVGCTRQLFTKSFPGDDAAVLAPSSGEEPASPRHRAGVASMAWRSTRRFSTNAP